MLTKRQLLGRSLCVWVVLELAAAAQVRGPDGATVLASWVRSLLSPVVDVSAQSLRTVADLRIGLADARQLARENSLLTVRLAEAENRSTLLQTDLEALSQANSALAGMPRLSGIPARCVHLDLGRNLLRVVTDETQRGRISRDTPAVADGGVVGRVIRAEGTSCWIEVASHPAAAIAVTTRDTTVHGMAEGTGSFDFSIEYVSHDARVSVGDPLFTSGADGIYPPGLPVGVVSRVRESDKPFLDIRARPWANISAVRSVWLITHQPPIQEGEPPP